MPGRFISFIHLGFLALITHTILASGVWALYMMAVPAPDIWVYGWIDPQLLLLVGTSGDFVIAARNYMLAITLLSWLVTILWIGLAIFVARPFGPGKTGTARWLWIGLVTLVTVALAVGSGQGFFGQDLFDLQWNPDGMVDLAAGTAVFFLGAHYWFGALPWTPAAVRAAVPGSWLLRR